MVTEPEPPPRHTPFREKHPVVTFTPFAIVDVPEVTFSCDAEMPPAKVDVPCPAPTVIAAAKVDVAVVDVAAILSVTIPVLPTTDRAAYGDVVATPALVPVNVRPFPDLICVPS